MGNKILISAYNINSGGGLLLLKSLMESTPPDIQVVLFADKRIERGELEFIRSEFVKIKFVKPTLLARILAELKMKIMSRAFDSHFCLGNLPPLFGSWSKDIIIYLHTRFIVDKSIDHKIPLRKFLITSLERVWFKMCMRHNYQVFVQTPTMLELTNKFSGNRFNTKELLFLPSMTGIQIDGSSRSGFIYVASFDAHKNFQNLIQAWKLLNSEGIRPELNLITSGEVSPEVMEDIKDLNINLIKGIRREDLLKAYVSAKCLIHPSFYESLGIVLLEAQHFGLDIIAPEADYVRDLLDPVETFDPHSPQSIARSVKRYLGINNCNLKVFSPSDLWKQLV